MAASGSLKFGTANGQRTLYHCRGNKSGSPTLCSTTQAIQLLVKKAAPFQPEELLVTFTPGRTYVDSTSIFLRYAHLYFIHGGMTQMVEGLIGQRERSLVKLLEFPPSTLAEQQERSGKINDEIEQLTGLLNTLRRVDFYALKKVLMVFPTGSGECNSWVVARSLDSEVRADISAEKSYQGKSGLGAFLGRLVETKSKLATTREENAYARDVSGLLFQKFDENRFFCEFNFSIPQSRQEHVTDIFLREACFFSMSRGMKKSYAGEGFVKSSLLDHCSGALSEEVGRCIRHIACIASRNIPIPLASNQKQTLNDYLVDYFRRIDWNIPASNAPAPSAPPSDVPSASLNEDELPSYQEASALPQGGIDRLVEAFSITTHPPTQQACFDAALASCRQRNWDQVRSAGEGLWQFTNTDGRSLLEEVIEEGDLALAIDMVRENIATNFEDKEGRTVIAEIATILNRLGVSMGDTEKALIHLEESLEIRRRLYPKNDHQDIAFSLTNLGRVLQGLVRVEEAWIMFEEALEVHSRNLPDPHPYIVASILNVGNVLRAMKRKIRAQETIQTAQDMLTRLAQEQTYPPFPGLQANLERVQATLGKSARIRGPGKAPAGQRNELFPIQEYRNQPIRELVEIPETMLDDEATWTLRLEQATKMVDLDGAVLYDLTLPHGSLNGERPIAANLDLGGGCQYLRIPHIGEHEKTKYRPDDHFMAVRLPMSQLGAFHPSFEKLLRGTENPELFFVIFKNHNEMGNFFHNFSLHAMFLGNYNHRDPQLKRDRLGPRIGQRAVETTEGGVGLQTSVKIAMCQTKGIDMNYTTSPTHSQRVIKTLVHGRESTFSLGIYTPNAERSDIHLFSDNHARFLVEKEAPVSSGYVLAKTEHGHGVAFHFLLVNDPKLNDQVQSVVTRNDSLMGFLRDIESYPLDPGIKEQVLRTFRYPNLKEAGKQPAAGSR